MNSVETITLIRTTLTRSGSGKDATSPIRIITQYWTQDGALVAETDPAAWILTPEALSAVEAIIDKLPQSTKDEVRFILTATSQV